MPMPTYWAPCPGKIKAILNGFGAELKPDDDKHRERCNYTLYYPVWPRSDFMDYKPWLKDYLDNDGLLELSSLGSWINDCGGKDISDDVSDNNLHALMLKFHIWSVNNWFIKYADPDSLYKQLYPNQTIK
jgi:hypothetical protein